MVLVFHTEKRAAALSVVAFWRWEIIQRNYLSKKPTLNHKAPSCPRGHDLSESPACWCLWQKLWPLTFQLPMTHWCCPAPWETPPPPHCAEISPHHHLLTFKGCYKVFQLCASLSFDDSTMLPDQCTHKYLRSEFIIPCLKVVFD